MRIFRVDPCLDGMAVEHDLVLRQRQPFTKRHTQLPFHQIDARDQFGHGMLDLQPGVHLDEEHLLAVGNKFDGAGADIVDRRGRLARDGAYRLALDRIKRRRRSFLDHLLVPPLQRAFALEQRQQIAVTVADDLHFDMARVFDEFFDQHAIVAERGLGLPLGADNGGRKLARGTHNAHAASAAAGGGLHQHGKSGFIGGGGQCRIVLGLAMIARHQRDAGLFHQQFGARFRAHQPDHGRRRADEYQTRIETGGSEFGALGKESVAGMHGFGTALARRFDHPLDVEIAVARPRRPEQDGFIGHGDMHRIAVRLRIDRDRAQPHCLCRADDAAGDLAAIGDQQGAKSPILFGAIHHHILNRPKRVGSIGAFADAESPSPSTSRVSAGSMTPSSQSRAVA